MSIENLKQYLQLGMSGIDVRVVDWLKELTKTTIEQHEEKEKLHAKYKMPDFGIEAVKEFVNQYESNDPVVEIGQVWRSISPLNKHSHIEIIKGVKLEFGVVDQEKFNLNLSEEFITNNYELVTMENIKPGEWVENNGIKFEVLENIDGNTVINYNGDRVAIPNTALVPALPPVEEQPKLYTQEEMEENKKIAYKEGYDTGNKYGYERAIEILQLQNH